LIDQIAQGCGGALTDGDMFGEMAILELKN